MKLALFFIALIALSSATDWIKCGQDAVQLGGDVYQLVKDAKLGDISKIVADLQTILADIQMLMKDCGIKDSSPEEFMRLYAELEESGLDTDWIKCAQSAIKLAADVSQLVKDAKTGDISKIVQDLQKILASINELKKNCGIKEADDENTDWIKCAQAAIKLAGSVSQLVKDAKTGDISKIVQDLQQILANITELKKNCGIKLIDENTDWIKCAQAAIKLAGSVSQLVKDAKTGDISKIVQDLQQILANITELKKNCGIKLEDINTDWIKCAQAAIKLASSVSQLVKDAKTGDISKIVQDLQKILSDIGELKKNCGIKYEDGIRG